MNFFLAALLSTARRKERVRATARLWISICFVVLVAMLGAAVSRTAHAAGAPASLLLPPSASDTARYATSSSLPPAGVVRQRPVAIDFASIAASNPARASQVTVELFDGQQIAIDLSRVETHGANSYSLYGQIRGHNKSYAILSVVNGQMSATIEFGETGSRGGGRFQVNGSSNGVHVLQQIDPASFPPDHPAGGVRVAGTTAKIASAGHDGESESRSTLDFVPKSDSGATIDVLVVYSNLSAAAAGSAIGAQIQQAVDTANQVYANSGITTRLRLVAYQQVNYDESGNIDTDLSWLTSNSSVASLRNTYGADLVSMFTESGGFCGSSWVGPSASSAFSVVNRGCSSSNYSFPHEIGHNFGARHDVYADASNSPYAYGHGYVDCSQGWRDVMAYPSQCGGTRIPYFSNPNATYGSPPDPLGVSSSADVVRVHNQNAVTVANFKQSVSSAGGCSYALSPTSASVGSAGASASFSVTAGSACAWNAASSDSTWLTIGSNSGTSASGTLYYTVAANGGPARSATISIGGQTFTVNQASGCSLSLSPTSANVPATGGSGSTALSDASGCPWTVSSSASWLTVTSATSGNGSTMVSYTVATNAGAARSANLSVGGSTLLVSQDAAAVTSTAPAATLSASTLQFGNQQVGKASKSKTVTLKNSGGGSLTIGSLVQGGANPDDFPVAGTCAVNAALASGQSCTLVYGFSPTAAGTRSATTSIGTPDGTVTISMSGNGTVPRTHIK